MKISMTKKTGMVIIVVLAFFVYGFTIGFFKVFPFDQILGIKHYVEHNYGFFSEEAEEVELTSVEIQNTLLQRILIKKIRVSSEVSFGGGITNEGDILYILSNKGEVFVYNLNSYSAMASVIEQVPMKYREFIQSAHPYRNEFRLNWFRVTGVYSETIGSGMQRLYVSHNAYDESKDCITHNISRIDLTIQSVGEISGESWNTIFTASPCIDPEPENWLGYRAYAGNISGGKIVEYDESRLLISIGDYNHHGLNDMPEYAMDESNPYGKFVLMDKESGEWTIYAKGNRNPSGLFVDNNERIWSAENGPRGGDELNIIEQGKNYGWPRVSYGLWYDPEYQLEEHLRGTHPVYERPVFSWVPIIAPSNLIRIEGDKFEHWQGDLILGTMADQSLRRLRITEENRVMYDERIPIGHRVRDLTVLPLGKIALITDDSYMIILDDGGPVHKEIDLEINERITELEKFDQIVAGREGSPEFEDEHRDAEMIFQRNCATCHNLNEVNQIGPHLFEIFNRRAGSLDNYPYSNVLRDDDRSWDPELLKKFLLTPESEFSGNNMPKIELTEAEADSIVFYLQQ